MKLGNADMMYQYLSLGGKACTFEVTYTLKNKVDVVLLEKACNTALDAFPLWKLRPYLTEDHHVIFKDNKEAAVVYEADGKHVCLGTDDTNGYLFRVMYKDNVIKLIGFHGLSDARGIMSYGTSLLYYYLTSIGANIDTTDIYTVENTRDVDAVTELLSERCSKEVVEDIDLLPPAENVYLIPDERVLFGTDKSKVLRLSWNNDEMMKYIKGVGGTPVTVFASMLGRALYDIYDIQDKNVVLSVPVDMRGKLNSRSQVNFTTNVSLVYHKEYLDLPIEQQVKELKKQLVEGTVFERLIKNINAVDASGNMLVSMAVDDPAIRAMVQSGGSKNPRNTILLSSVGVVKVPVGMEEYVDNIDMSGTNLDYTPAYVPYSFGSKGYLSIVQNYEEKDIPLKLISYFEDCGVKVELEDRGYYVADNVEPLKYRRDNE